MIRNSTEVQNSVNLLILLESVKYSFIISIILILSGPVAMVVHHQTGGTALNYALDFSGGTATTVTFNEDMDIKQIDSEVTPVVEEVTGDKNVQPTKVSGTNQVVIKTRTLYTGRT